jgi:hypothetical protein
MVAAAIAHAKKMGTKWAIPQWTLDRRVWPNYFLNTLGYGHIVPNGFMSAIIYKEKRHCYDPLPNEDHLTIEGYFQSEKYFADAKEQIGNALGFHCSMQDYVAIHVRRGDYLKYPDHHPVLRMDYYGNAIIKMMIKGHVKFKIYSDDIDWCKNAFNVPYYKNIQIEFDNSHNELLAMRDMYNARAFIIANSTFSLFPALLRLDNPFVIAPQEYKWFGPANKHLDTVDLMPERFFNL